MSFSILDGVAIIIDPLSFLSLLVCILLLIAQLILLATVGSIAFGYLTIPRCISIGIIAVALLSNLLIITMVKTDLIRTFSGWHTQSWRIRSLQLP